VHGVLKHEDAAPEFFGDDALEKLRARQVRAASYADGLIGALYDVVPPRTWIIVTSDHGELFGEGGYFGHGPIAHDKVLEVPFVEGTIR
jgi:arylsulfatase A-like enzyme